MFGFMYIIANYSLQFPGMQVIYLSYLKKGMQENNLFKKYTMHELLDELDVIECFENPGRDPRMGEVTKRQAALYEAMGVVPPTSLQ
jgi:hypothetical protein